MRYNKKAVITNPRIFNVDAILSSMIPFLQLNEIPRFARINKRTGQLIHRLINSGNFQHTSGVYKRLLESLQRDAKIILDNPLPTYQENSPALLKALNNLMSGKIDTQTVNALRQQRLIYRTQTPDEALSLARDAAGASIDAITPDGSIFFQRDGRITCLIFIFMLLLAGVSLVYGGVEYSVNFCINRCRARRQQESLQQRLFIFKDIADAKEEKSLSDEQKYKDDPKCR